MYRLLAKWITKDPEPWIALGNTETRLLSYRLKPVAAPLYICGLARAGTTILTEALATHPQIATHAYRDFPCLFTPYFWNRILRVSDRIPHKAKPRERAHRDGIMVTPKSPEAMEEMLWMAFFRNLHDETRSAVLGAQTSNPAFAAFYRAHIQKLLLVRKKARYAAKANYNLTRIPYLLTLFPDARFVVVIRNPLAHVWSLYRKDALFRAEQERDPATLLHMDQAGHFEFGQHRTLIHTGDDACMSSIRACFAAGEDVKGWARYWAMLYGYVRTVSAAYPEVLVVRHEDLCGHPAGNMRGILAHCRLEYDDAALNTAAAMLHEGSAPAIPEDARRIILEETSGVTAQWPYDGQRPIEI